MWRFGSSPGCFFRKWALAYCIVKWHSPQMLHSKGRKFLWRRKWSNRLCFFVKAFSQYLQQYGVDGVRTWETFCTLHGDTSLFWGDFWFVNLNFCRTKFCLGTEPSKAADLGTWPLFSVSSLDSWPSILVASDEACSRSLFPGGICKYSDCTSKVRLL